MKNNKSTQRGEPLAFFEESLTKDTDDCIDWNYSCYPRGYGYIWRNGKNVRVTRLALERLVGSPPVGKESACHKCHNPKCFNPRHLYWGSHSENMMDRVKDGTSNRGERCASSKLVTDQVLDIRQDKRTIYAIAKEYGVTWTTIKRIKTRERWGWLGE